MRTLAIATILNGIAYLGMGSYYCIELVDYIDSADQWFLVLFLVLYFLGGIGCLVFAARTLKWHNYDNANESEELLDLSFEETRPILSVDGGLRVAQMCALAAVTLIAGWTFVRLPGLGLRDGESVLFFWTFLLEVLSVAALIYLLRTLNLKKLLPEEKAP